MRILVDECTGPAVAKWLREQGHEVFSVYEDTRGLSDDEVMTLAYAENRILITNDKDFGEKIFREQRQHCGVIFLRLDDERAPNKIAVLEQVLITYADQLVGQFVVVSENRIRFAGRPF